MTGYAGGHGVIRVISGKVALNHKKQAGFEVRGRDPPSFFPSQNGRESGGLPYSPNVEQVGLLEVPMSGNMALSDIFSPPRLPCAR